jgi:hypothetical protein
MTDQAPAIDTSTNGHVSPDENVCTTKDDALLYAWRHFIAFDAVSNNQKRLHLRYRRLIIILGFVASATAVLSILPPVEWFFRILEENSQGSSVGFILLARVLVIIAPITIAILMALALQFAPGVVWVIHRVYAESIKREIYLYRAKSEKYRPTHLTNLQRKQRLIRAVDRACAEIDKLDTLIPYQQEISKSNLDELPKRIKPSKSENIRGYTDHESDNGFSPISGAEYDEWRVVAQRNWYANRMQKDYRYLEVSRIVVLLIGGFGTFFAAMGFGWERMVVVTTALAVAITTYIQLKMYGQVYANYHRTIKSLDTRIMDWTLLTPEEKSNPEQSSKYVCAIENIFRSERRKWMEQAMQAMVTTEQAIAKNVNEWTNNKKDSSDAEKKVKKDGSEG